MLNGSLRLVFIKEKEIKMKKRILALFFVVVMLVSVCSVNASARSLNASVHSYDQLTQTLALNALKVVVTAANRQIELYVRIAQHTPYNDVDWMLTKVDTVVSYVNFVAANLNLSDYAVECEYVYYEIDGQTVAVDPLKVIYLGDDSIENQ